MKTTRSGIGTMIMAGLAMISATATGCAGDPSAPTERNFQAGIEAYYERVRPCFYLPGVYPNTVQLRGQEGHFLTDMGFATEAVTVENAYGRPIQQWDLTEAGRAAVDSIIEPKPYEPGDRAGEDWGRTTFCYGSEYVGTGNRGLVRQANWRRIAGESPAEGRNNQPPSPRVMRRSL